ncbi:MAG: hypothetical protein JWR44_790 [Hymenobacter sp.]|jgi:hypothetical protein|nr:hypothetical protein [Hymenobacter sp.]
MKLLPFPVALPFASSLLLTTLLAQPVAAQKYRTAAGFRSDGVNYGLTVQQLFLPKATLEGLGMIAPRERSVTLLAERHFGILGPSLNYYFGAGGHYGVNKDDGEFWGFDGIIGAEYKIAFLPVVLSLDFKPTIEHSSADWNRFPTGFSVRYIIVKQKKTGFFNDVIEKIKTKRKGSDSN